MLAGSASAHASARLHEADIRRVFDGYENPQFMRIVKSVSSGMDNELPKRFRAKIGSVPGNHRVLGHCWSFGDAIPRRVFEAIEKKHPGRSTDFVELWREFSTEIVANAQEITGYSRKDAQALVALIHDVHLLGDRTPDNKLMTYVLTPEEIAGNIIKEMNVLWPGDGGKKSALALELRKIVREHPLETGQAELMLKVMEQQEIGYRLNNRNVGSIVAMKEK